jgi:hypothetical protein
MRCVLVLLGFTLCAVPARGEDPPIPPHPAKPAAGLEAGTWTVEAWGNPGAAEVITVGEQKLLKLSCTGGEKEKVAFSQALAFDAAADGKLRLHVYAPEPKAPPFAVVLLTGKDHVWHETPPFALKQGWNALEYPLNEPRWKTKATQWKFQASVAEPQDIRGFGLLVLNGKDSRWLAVAGLAADLSPATKKVAELIEKLQDQDGEVRAKAEAELVAIGRPAVLALTQLKDSKRPEVALRAGWALDKIEGRHGAEKRQESTKKREAAGFADARRRVDQALKGLESGRERLQVLAQEARDELERAAHARKDLKAPSEEELKAYDAALEKLDKLSKELQNAIGAPAPKPAEAEAKK